MLTDEGERVFQQPTICRKRPGTAWRNTSSRRTSPGNIKGRGEESHTEFKKGKAASCSGFPIDLIKHIGESGVDMMHEILKRVWEEEQVPEEWEKSEIVPQIQAKGGPTRMWEL